MARVTLLSCTPQAELLVASAARSCYSEKSSEDLMQETRLDDESFLDTIIKSGHYSVLEHASYTFSIGGISRACTHQLVRHRIASFSQQSQRYVKFDDSEYYIPESIQNSQYEELYNLVLQTITLTYDVLVENGIPEEDARYILPNAAKSNITVTMNVRELLHFFSLRCCNRAQKEIRDIAWQMLHIVQLVSPSLFKNAGPSCIRGKCIEGKKSCGNPYTKD